MSAVGGPYFAPIYDKEVAEVGLKLKSKVESQKGEQKTYSFAGKILKPEGQELGKRDNVKLFFYSWNYVRLRDATGHDTNMLISIDDIAQKTGLTPTQIKESNEAGNLGQTIMDRMKEIEKQKYVGSFENNIIADKEFLGILQRIKPYSKNNFECTLFIDPETKKIKEAIGPGGGSYVSRDSLLGTVPVKAEINSNPEKNQYTINIKSIDYNNIDEELPVEVRSKLFNSQEEFLRQVLDKVISPD